MTALSLLYVTSREGEQQKDNMVTLLILVITGSLETGMAVRTRGHVLARAHNSRARRISVTSHAI